MLQELIRAAREELQEQLSNGEMHRSVVKSIRRELIRRAAREIMYEVIPAESLEYEMTNGRPRRIR